MARGKCWPARIFSTFNDWLVNLGNKSFYSFFDNKLTLYLKLQIFKKVILMLLNEKEKNYMYVIST